MAGNDHLSGQQFSRALDRAPATGSVADEQTTQANKFLYHYAQSRVWRGESDRLRSAGDQEGSAHADQHALGHALHVADIRDQMSPQMHREVQSAANAYGKRDDFSSRLPMAWRDPQPASEVPINGGGLNGDTKWYPPGHPKHYSG